MRHILTALLAFLVTMPATVMAADLGDVKVNGFVTQGFIDSSGNNYLAESENGTTQFNEIGLTVSANPSKKLRIGAQLLARDLGNVGNNEVNLDWGFADYRWKDYLGIRLGKVKMPIGLYNEARDSDFMRAMIFLPQSIYEEDKRDILNAYQGSGLYGNLPLGFLGDADYHVFGGQINFSDDAPAYVAFKGGAVKTARQKYSNPSLGVSSYEYKNDYVMGGNFAINTPIDGLRLVYSHFNGKTDIDINLSNGTAEEATIRMKNRKQFSIEYATDYFTLASEYAEWDNPKDVMGSKSNATTQAYYGLLSVPVGGGFSVSALYDVIYDDKDDKDGLKLIAQGKQDYQRWRKDFGVGVRYDVNFNWTLKAEYHTVDGAAGTGIALLNSPTPEEHWDYYALKASFNF